MFPAFQGVQVIDAVAGLPQQLSDDPGALGREFVVILPDLFLT